MWFCVAPNRSIEFVGVSRQGSGSILRRIMFFLTWPMNWKILEFIWETMPWPNSNTSTTRSLYILLSTSGISPVIKTGQVLCEATQCQTCL